MSINTQLRGLGEVLSDRQLASAYIFPEAVEPATRAGAVGDELFVFQYYPDGVQDTYNPEWSTKQVPGGSHPLYQWNGGSGRDISFTARFTAERDLDDVRGKTDGLLPSDRYTVDIRGALGRLRSYMMGSYGNQQGSGISSRARPPKKLWLVLQGLSLGGVDWDPVLMIVRSAPISFESSFPNGHPRIVEVSMTCSEIVQRTAAGSGGSTIQFIGRDKFETEGQNYQFRGTVDRALGQ